jgi:predicted nuclease of predicted toxin-antitoxin system
MVDWLNQASCDALHTIDLPDKNRATDEQIIHFADGEQRVVVSKDAGFVSSHILSGRPAKLLLISTGNIRNKELEELFVPLIPSLVAEFQVHDFLELGRAGIIIRG